MATEELTKPVERTNADAPRESTRDAGKTSSAKLGATLVGIALIGFVALTITIVWAVFIGWLVVRLLSWLF